LIPLSIMRIITSPPIGHMVDVDGRRFWMDRAGEGRPAVVFAPGAGSVALDFLLVHQRVAEMTTSVLYDRAGTGWSENVQLPRSADAVIDELRAALRALEVPAPYLLVGHSLGALYVQRFAQRFPSETAGLLLLDPAHEDWDLYMPEHLKIANNQPADSEMPELPEGFVAECRAILADTFREFPEPVRAMLVDKHLSPERLPTGFREGTNVLALFEELRSGGPRPNVPLIILSGTAIDRAQTLFASETQLREQIDGSQRLYHAMIATAGGEHRILDDASHPTIPMTRPDAVAQAVADLLDGIRRV
jgi:pimeloyl-ACP methyl ester carboxylesterase